MAPRRSSLSSITFLAAAMAAATSTLSGPALALQLSISGEYRCIHKELPAGAINVGHFEVVSPPGRKLSANVSIPLLFQYVSVVSKARELRV